MLTTYSCSGCCFAKSAGEDFLSFFLSQKAHSLYRHSAIFPSAAKKEDRDERDLGLVANRFGVDVRVHDLWHAVSVGANSGDSPAVQCCSSGANGSATGRSVF